MMLPESRAGARKEQRMYGSRKVVEPERRWLRDMPGLDIAFIAILGVIGAVSVLVFYLMKK